MERKQSGNEISKVVKIIQKGGIVAYPTETFYGLGGNALDERTVTRVFQIKRRPFHKPISILIPGLKWLERLVVDIPPLAQDLIKAYWPGPLTIVFKAKTIIPSILTGFTGKIGIRISSHPLAQKLLQELDLPLTATSANISGHPPPTKVTEIEEKLKSQIEAVLDGGQTKGNLPSTVVDLTISPARIVRPGVINLATSPFSLYFTSYAHRH